MRLLILTLLTMPAISLASNACLIDGKTVFQKAPCPIQEITYSAGKNGRKEQKTRSNQHRNENLREPSNLCTTYGAWISSKDKIAACFPSEPQVINGNSTTVAVKQYWTEKAYEDSGAQFKILLSPIKSDNYTNPQQAVIIESTARPHLKTLQVDEQKMSWTNLPDGRPVLRISYKKSHLGTPIISEGFYLVDKNRLVYVSVLYGAQLQKKSTDEIRSFLQTFVLLEY